MHEPLQHACTDEHVATGRQALTVEVGGGVGEGVGRVVDEGDQGVGHLIADPVLEHAAALRHRLTVEGARHHTEQHRRHEGVEHDGGAAAGGLGGTEQAGGPVGGITGGLGEVELVGRPADAEAETALGLVAVVGEGADADVAAVLPPGPTDAGGGGHRGFDSDVGVVGIVDTHTCVDAQGELLELLG